MKFEIDILETVKKLNTYVIEVDNEEEGEEICKNIENDINEAIHPDDVAYAFYRQGVKIIEFIDGAEEAEYEFS